MGAWRVRSRGQRKLLCSHLPHIMVVACLPTVGAWGLLASRTLLT